MPLFADLKQEEFEEIRKTVELVSFNPGDIVCDEHERSDCMYIVRQGLIKVVKSVSHLVAAQDVTDWTSFAKNLKQGEPVPASPAGKLWALLPEVGDRSCATPGGGEDRPGGSERGRPRRQRRAHGPQDDRGAEFKAITDSESFTRPAAAGTACEKSRVERSSDSPLQSSAAGGDLPVGTEAAPQARRHRDDSVLLLGQRLLRRDGPDAQPAAAPPPALPSVIPTTRGRSSWSRSRRRRSGSSSRCRRPFATGSSRRSPTGAR